MSLSSVISTVKKKINHSETEKIIYAKLKKNASQWFEKIGTGSSRDVYDVDGKYVIKVAKNPKGLAQNQKEYEVSRDGYVDDIIAKVIYIASDESFLVMEHARKIKSNKEFKQIMGFGIDYLNHHVHVTHSWKTKNFDWMTYQESDKPTTEKQKELVGRIDDYIVDYVGNEAFGDVGRLSSWGIKKRNGRPTGVLIDYGIDQTIYKKHYEKRPNR
jgi:hypothetical protein